MLIDQLNLNHLRIFECVYRKRSMTQAADELHLTQSGISQHMASLEEVLEVKLFDRIKQKLVPTAEADRLFKRCFDALNGIEQALSEIKGGETRLVGKVLLGIPIEFGNNVVLPILSEFLREHPLVQVGITYGFASEMNDKLLNGILDLAFVDEFSMDRRIRVEPVYDEALHLCATADLIKKVESAHTELSDKMSTSERKKFFEAMEYVDYQSGEPLLRMWFGHHLGTRNLNLNVRGVLMDVQGISRLVAAGLAAGILPGHLFEKLKKEGVRLHSFEGSGKPLRNTISMAYLPERSASTASVALREWFFKRLTKKSGTEERKWRRSPTQTQG